MKKKLIFKQKPVDSNEQTNRNEAYLETAGCYKDL